MDSDYLAYPWNEQLWNDVFTNEDSRYFLCSVIEKEELLGFSLFEINKWSQQAHLLKIVICPEARGSGIASKLFLFCRDRIKESGMEEIYLEVDASNKRAVSFYKKNHFTVLCVKKSFYSDGADAQAMLLSL
tara:strand:- start:978 stop:1373 length:396 start_codon:yes stop_codon:yes gene_type:complete